MYLNHERGCRVFAGQLLNLNLKGPAPTFPAITICRFFARILFVRPLQVIRTIKCDKMYSCKLSAIIGLVISYFVTSYMTSPREGNVL